LATSSGNQTITISGISDNDTQYHYLLFALDNTSSNRTLYFNFFDSGDVNINDGLGYITDPDVSAVDCSISGGNSTYFLPIVRNALLSKITIEFDDVSGVGGARSVVFAGIVTSTSNLSASTFPCFTASSLVLMSDYTQKSIADIKYGDIVMSNPVTKKQTLC
jgi:hypothetical protein